MSKLRRYPANGHPSFFTIVTHERATLLESNAECLLNVIERYQKKYGFRVPAWVILPDHFHLIVDGDGEHVSGIVHRIKTGFTNALRKDGVSKKSRVWQHRFWDHIIRNQDDLNKHIDYIHYNPVKHGLVDRLVGWRWSSFGAYLEDETYSPDWGMVENEWEGYGEPL